MYRFIPAFKNVSWDKNYLNVVIDKTDTQRWVKNNYFQKSDYEKIPPLAPVLLSDNDYRIKIVVKDVGTLFSDYKSVNYFMSNWKVNKSSEYSFWFVESVKSYFYKDTGIINAEYTLVLDYYMTWINVINSSLNGRFEMTQFNPVDYDYKIIDDNVSIIGNYKKDSGNIMCDENCKDLNLKIPVEQDKYTVDEGQLENFYLIILSKDDDKNTQTTSSIHYNQHKSISLPYKILLIPQKNNYISTIVSDQGKYNNRFDIFIDNVEPIIDVYTSANYDDMWTKTGIRGTRDENGNETAKKPNIPNYITEYFSQDDPDKHKIGDDDETLSYVFGIDFGYNCEFVSLVSLNIDLSRWRTDEIPTDSSEPYQRTLERLMRRVAPMKSFSNLGNVYKNDDNLYPIIILDLSQKVSLWDGGVSPPTTITYKGYFGTTSTIFNFNPLKNDITDNNIYKQQTLQDLILNEYHSSHYRISNHSNINLKYQNSNIVKLDYKNIEYGNFSPKLEIVHYPVIGAEEAGTLSAIQVSDSNNEYNLMNEKYILNSVQGNIYPYKNPVYNQFLRNRQNSLNTSMNNANQQYNTSIDNTTRTFEGATFNNVLSGIFSGILATINPLGMIGVFQAGKNEASSAIQAVNAMNSARTLRDISIASTKALMLDASHANTNIRQINANNIIDNLVRGMYLTGNDTTISNLFYFKQELLPELKAILEQVRQVYGVQFKQWLNANSVWDFINRRYWNFVKLSENSANILASKLHTDNDTKNTIYHIFSGGVVMWRTDTINSDTILTYENKNNVATNIDDLTSYFGDTGWIHGKEE